MRWLNWRNFPNFLERRLIGSSWSKILGKFPLLHAWGSTISIWEGNLCLHYLSLCVEVHDLLLFISLADRLMTDLSRCTTRISTCLTLCGNMINSIDQSKGQSRLSPLWTTGNSCQYCSVLIMILWHHE